MASIAPDTVPAQCFRRTTAAEAIEKLEELIASDSTAAGTILDYYDAGDEVVVVELQQGFASHLVGAQIEDLDDCDDMLVTYRWN